MNRFGTCRVSLGGIASADRANPYLVHACLGMVFQTKDKACLQRDVPAVFSCWGCTDASVGVKSVPMSRKDRHKMLIIYQMCWYLPMVYCRLSCMAVHNADFITDDDSWENSSAEFEQRFQLGSEMTSLSRSASSSEKTEMLDNFHVKFNLSRMR